ncbi:MAG TPA: CAP domain-containing protein [Gaiellaceae bacterium]|nr:CAP domain-containing protein [Gaiellaceae bacterium]
MGRGILLLGATVLAAGSAAASAPAATHGQNVALSSLEQGVLADVNAFRAQNHLPALTLSAPLTLAARSHSEQMATDGYFAHPSQNGTAFWKRIQTFYPSTNFGYWSVGENLLWSSPDVGAQQAVVMWENSPEHRANMLDPHWHEIGISAVHVASAPGVYSGRPVTIVTTDFGVRS